MSRRNTITLTGVVLAVALALLSMGVALAWFYEKDQTPTRVNPAGSDPVVEVIRVSSVNPEGTVDAIIVSSLRFCAEGAVVSIGPEGEVISPWQADVPPFLCTGDVQGMPVSSSISGDELTVSFAPPEGNVWGDIFPVGTTSACITGEVDGDPNGLRNLDGPGEDGKDIPLCQPLEIAEGRMTGGGSVFNNNDSKDTGVRVTRGFEIHCDLRDPNNLQVNEHGRSKLNFHLTELTSANCIDHPMIFQDPPPGTPFDTFIGKGTGTLKTGPGTEVTAYICFVFVDDGEPGDTDIAAIQIRTSGPFDCMTQNLGVPYTGDPPPVLLAPDASDVLYVNGTMRNGNLQAHEDTP